LTEHPYRKTEDESFTDDNPAMGGLRCRYIDCG
jgi:hypothetical protein